MVENDDEKEPGVDTTGLAPARRVEDDGIERDETFVDAFDAQRLFCQTWRPADEEPSQGCVALLHGYGEHSARYGHVAAALVRAGYAVMAIDARGAGRSTGARAYVESFDHYVRDFRTLLERLDRRWPDLPRFALGHSNGGLVVLRYALALEPDERGVDGVAVTSPFLGFRLDVPRHKSLPAKLLSRLWPTFALPTEIDPSQLSHDPRVAEAYEDDPLVQRIATARWFTEVRAAQRDLLERAGSIETPALFLVAGADEIADPDVTRRLFHRLGAPDREMEVFPNLYHEILNEPEWGRIVERLVEWMNRQIESNAAEDAA